MAAMVQTYPQQTATVTMLQTRPSSSSGIMNGHAHSQSQPNVGNQQYMANSQPHRNSFHGLPGVVGGQTGYRGSSPGPVQPYAFTTTPNLANNGAPWQSYGAYRTTSNPNVSTMQTIDHANNAAARPRYHTSGSMTNIHNGANSSAVMAQGVSRDDSSLPSMSRAANSAASRPQSVHLTTSSGQQTFAQVAATKASPERYRRPSPRQVDSQQSSQAQGSAMPSGSGMATVVHLYNPRAMGNQRIPRNSANLASRPQSAYGSLMTGAAADDMLVPRQPTDEDMKRFRRRSMHSIDSADYPNPLTPQEFKKQQAQAEEALRLKTNSSFAGNEKPNAATHTRSGSSESIVSSRSSNSRPSSSTNRNSNVSAPTTTSPASTTNDEKSSNPDQLKLVNIPPRSSSTDVGKRVLNPSPLSKPVTMDPASSSGDSAAPAKSNGPAVTSPTKPPGSSHGSAADSPAAKHLAAINEKGGRPKTKTSRLRRAFSFGSAAELRKSQAKDQQADTPSTAVTAQHGPSKLHKDPQPDDLYEEEQARIAQLQEESGLGNSIYSGTKIFTGSNDNLSISSTASSASVMLRKMGRGMKKGGRSLVGLFRPKSIIGSPTGDTPGASRPEVSMVTVEAERERVNVNANGDLGAPSGGTGFPHLERNSIDAIDAVHADSLTSDRLGSSGTDNSGARKSIVGGEKERAEVLATIRKGILKTRSNSPSPSPRGQDTKGPIFELPLIPNVTDSPSSSAPSTPNEDAQGHKRSGSVAIGNEDYFMSALRLRQDTKSAPGTPQGSISKRNATFSPRIVFYDTWPSQEYDRRGEIATCNRLTPMLAQQIKEELNSFKMEMEVHETSKIYTHFF
ncbi:uncharacterized protein BCR38DRAFT_333498 [Pseudomassariella vexata]|uniref:Protein BNI4 n=1 Tax=Pseudomassariella vexata TaxID=1141098 RepID=A0A1Y2EEX4_9PEZI|nr:uncharacterized protein BCR38DRAFT_333498 [Pseudomassariella vexata]ORY70110.1 hypothetical protein BCR38DRAFT_333498 [Pseudomassariella vexata]